MDDENNIALHTAFYVHAMLSESGSYEGREYSQVLKDIIKKLVEIYPEGTKCRDNQGNESPCKRQ